MMHLLRQVGHWVECFERRLLKNEERIVELEQKLKSLITKNEFQTKGKTCENCKHGEEEPEQLDEHGNTQWICVVPIPAWILNQKPYPVGRIGPALRCKCWEPK